MFLIIFLKISNSSILMNKEHRISYGCHKAYRDTQLKDQIHHIWDSGLTGAGIAPKGHSQYSLCGLIPVHENYLYMLDTPLSMAKDFLSPIVIDELPMKFCQECLDKLYKYIKRNHIK